MLYDVVVDLEQMTLPDACDMVCDTARMGRYKMTSESRKAMEDLALCCHLQALVSNNRSISGAKNVKIKVDGGVVTIEGTVECPVDADRVRMLVRETVGVKEINSRMRVRFWGNPLARAV